MKGLASSCAVAALLSALSCLGCARPEPETAAETAPIIGGVAAVPGEWPGIVKLYPNGCAGTLVARDWVLTAGHCVVDPTQANGGIQAVIIGRYNLADHGVGEDHRVKTAIRHEHYDETAYANDIALLELETSSTFPTANLGTASQAEAGAVSTVVGWGVTTNPPATLSDVLMKVDIPIISNDECKRHTGYDVVTDDMLCAGAPNAGSGACYGDSGGPLYTETGGEIVQVGITSWGLACAVPEAPTVFTRTSAYVDWIRKTSRGAVVRLDAPR